ncbi:hypothetical protein GW17_00017302 [Ensete ventricosum]|nr:hypothetical protein GW17_00017302 [Ensete ventricosum]
MRAPDMPHTASNRGRLPATPDLALKFRKQQGSPGPRGRGQYLRVLRRYPQHLPLFVLVLIETGAASESKSEEMWIYREALPDCDYTSGKGEGSGRLTRGAFSFAAPRNVRVLLPEVSN